MQASQQTMVFDHPDITITLGTELEPSVWDDITITNNSSQVVVFEATQLGRPVFITIGISQTVNMTDHFILGLSFTTKKGVGLQTNKLVTVDGQFSKFGNTFTVIGSI